MKRLLLANLKINGHLDANHQLLKLLESCKTMREIKHTHAQMIATGLILHPFCAIKLIQVLSGWPACLHYAHQVFEYSPQPSLLLYNTIIKAHATTNHSSHNSLLLFRAMLCNSGLLPNRYTFIYVFNACCTVSGVREGDQVRVHAIKRGFETNIFVTNVLIRMYSGMGLIVDARRVFDHGTDRDLYSWNLIIGGYVSSSDMEQARILFDKMLDRDVVSWTTLITGYVQVDCFEEAILLFRDMQLAGVAPNEYTLTCSLTACANLVALDQGRWIHAYIKKARIKMNEKLFASVIDMYAKCGEVDFASKMFHSEENKKETVWPWNALIGGFAMHGRSKDAINLFNKMELASISPNQITFLVLLKACSHGSLVDEGRSYFKLMCSLYGIEPGIEHYGCLVDLLGRAGHLKEAEDLISAMPIAPDTTVWGALLNGCRIHGDVERGERVGNIIRKLEPKHVGCTLLLANMYSESGRWTDARHLRENVETGGTKKVPGCSSIELNGMFHQFLVGDRSHPQTEEIYLFLDEMAIKLKRAGYVPEIREVLLDVDEEEKETALRRHSERLAIAFGLINTRPGTTIRIVKNLRVCRDCHQVTKFISKVYEREIIVRDRIRFHHFKDGLCSCNDYW